MIIFFEGQFFLIDFTRCAVILSGLFGEILNMCSISCLLTILDAGDERSPDRDIVIFSIKKQFLVWPAPIKTRVDLELR